MRISTEIAGPYGSAFFCLELDEFPDLESLDPEPTRSGREQSPELPDRVGHNVSVATEFRLIAVVPY